MTTETAKFQFVAKLARQCPEAQIEPMIEAVRRLLMYSKQHGKLQEDKCNRPWTDRDEANEETTEAILKATALSIPGVVGIIFSGDPRGNTVELVLANGCTDDFGGEGLCVPQ